MSNILNENIKSLIESKRDIYPSLTESGKREMELLLRNTYKEMQALSEGQNVSSDVAQFTPIMMPLVRRLYPTLIANELLGVQPMTMPTGYIYALVNRYTGDGDTKTITPANKGMILVVEGTAPAVGDTLTGSTSGATGEVVYVEEDKVLVKLTNDAVFEVEDNIKAVYTNEANFHKILKNYTGPYVTADGEKLAKDMAEVGFSIERKNVEAQTRKLKGRYTLEMYEDLKAQHGLMADEEIMSLMKSEIQQELDREVVDFINNNATVVANAFAPAAADGRWEIEKYRAEVIKIANEARNIGILTKRGSGNVLLVSPRVATMLEQVGSFIVAKQPSDVTQPISGGVAGIFDGRYKVVVDQYAKDDYITVLYKGVDRRDAIGFFSPYVPLSFQSVMDPNSGQPGIIARLRYALSTTPLEPENYARTFGVSFSNTALAF